MSNSNQTQPKDFGYGEEQDMLKNAAQRFISDLAPLEALRKDIAGTEDPYLGEERRGFYDADAWREMAALGWSALAVPERCGGAEMGLVTAVALAEEIGAAAMPTPLTSTLQSTFLLREMATPEADAVLSRIAEGAAVTWAFSDAHGCLHPRDTSVIAEQGRLSGTAHFVQDLQKADVIVVAAQEDAGVAWYALDAGGEGVALAADRIVDLTRDQGRVILEGASGTRLTDAAAGLAAYDAALPALLTLLAADIAGAAEWVLQATAEYAKTRQQFDRPIGFFQAVKHPIVDMMIAADQSRSLVYAAACAFDFDREDALRLALLAKSSASDTAGFCANRGTQLHGGIGFTWESDVQIYHKRLMHAQQLLGDGVAQRAALAALL